MQHTHNLHNCLSYLVIKNKAGLVSFTYPYLTKQILVHVKLLLSFNFINGYRVDKCKTYPSNYTITVYFKYGLYGKSYLDEIRFFSRPGCYRFLTLKKIKQLVRLKTFRGSFFVVSTSFGVLTALECLQKRCSGLLLYYVSI